MKIKTVNQNSESKLPQNPSSTDLDVNLPSREQNPRGLRIITFNMQNGTPASGWPDPDVGEAYLRNSKSGIHTMLRDWAKLVGPQSIATRTSNARDALLSTTEILRKLQADVICLQEVDKGQRRSGYFHQTRFLSESLKMPYWRVSAAFTGPVFGWHRRPMHANITREGGYGIAMMSRWPVKSWHHKRLGKSRTSLRWGRGRWQGFSHGFLEGCRSIPTAFAGLRLNFGQMRVLQAARILTPYGVVSLGNTHLDTHKSTAAGQLRRSWSSVVELSADSAILVGDFNQSAVSAQDSLQLLKPDTLPLTHGFVPSYPADAPRFFLDQLLAQGWELSAQPQALRLPVSDHCAVVFDLTPINLVS